jgi:hypothetical protein
MGKLGPAWAFLRDCVVVLGAIACIFVWLKIEPGDMRVNAEWPHWMWLVCAIALMCVSLATSAYSRYRLYRIEHRQTKVDARPVNRSEVYDIAFRYLPGSPLSNGWKVAYQDEGAKPSFTSPEAPGIGGLSMDVKESMPSSTTCHPTRKWPTNSNYPSDTVRVGCST